MIKNKSTLTAWIIALILLAGTIAFVLIKSRGEPTDKYAFLNQSILKMIKSNEYAQNKFAADVATKVENHFSIYDMKKLEIKKSKVLYEITTNQVGHIGYIIQFINNENLISYVLNFNFNAAGKIYDVSVVV